MYRNMKPKASKSFILITLSIHSLHSLKCPLFQSNGRLGYYSKRCTFSKTKLVILYFGLYEGGYFLVAD